ncbi:DUF5723 family protein [Hymenobacter coalescens]
MKHFSPRLLTAGLGLLLPCAAVAQNAFSPAHSNYAGLSGMTWNPATLADNRYTFQLQLIGFDAYATNNAYRYVGPWSPRNTGASLDLSQRYLSLRAGDDARLGGAGLTVRGPGLLLRLNARNTLAVSSRVRVAVQANQASPDFIRNAVDGFEQRADVRNQTFNLNMNATSEWNLGYGRVVLDKERHFLKAGVTVRRLSGFGSAYLQMQALDYEVVTRTAATGDSTLRIKRLKGGFGYSNPDAFDNFDAQKALDWLKPGNAPGSGWGLDLGVVYEFRPTHDKFHYIDKKGRDQVDHSRNKYRFRVSAAVTDMGAVRYQNAVNYADIQTANLSVSESDVEGLDIDNFDTRINRILRTIRYGRDNTLKAKLPTALHLDVDYRLLGKLYLNAAVNQGMTGPYAAGMRTFSTATLTPRLETKWLELAPSFALLNNYRTFATGMSVRMGPLLIGSNDLSALFDSSDPYGASAYVEFSLLNIGNSRHKLKKKAAKESKPRPAVVPTAPPVPAPAATPAVTPEPASVEPTPAEPAAQPADPTPTPEPAATEPTTPTATPAAAPTETATPAVEAPAEPQKTGSGPR